MSGAQSSETHLFPADVLRDWVTALFQSAGVRDDDAELLSDSLVAAELWGHRSHGVMRASWYFDRMASGGIDVAARPTPFLDSGAIAGLDGNHGIGQVIARDAMQDAIVRSKAHGVGVVSVRNSGHFGTAMYFTRMAAEQGCIGVLTTNASPALAPWGGRKKLIGNNPWSIAAPSGGAEPVILDIANTVVARGKIFHAKARDEDIPTGWAIDADGAPTVNPAAALAGVILPMGGHKGYAISMMMDVLSGVLSGSGFADGVTGPYAPTGHSCAGHLAIALDIARFRPMDAFLEDMRRYCDKIKSADLAPGVDEVFWPGELEARSMAAMRARGVETPAAVVEELNTRGAAQGLAPLDAPL